LITLYNDFNIKFRHLVIDDICFFHFWIARIALGQCVVVV